MRMLSSPPYTLKSLLQLLLLTLSIHLDAGKLCTISDNIKSVVYLSYMYLQVLDSMEWLSSHIEAEMETLGLKPDNSIYGREKEFETVQNLLNFDNDQTTRCMSSFYQNIFTDKLRIF